MKAGLALLIQKNEVLLAASSFCDAREVVAGLYKAVEIWGGVDGNDAAPSAATRDEKIAAFEMAQVLLRQGNDLAASLLPRKPQEQDDLEPKAAEANVEGSARKAT